MAEDDALDVELGQHRRRYLAGERAVIGLVHVLGVHRDPRTAGGVHHRPERRERRADRHVDPVHRGDAREQRLDELLSLLDGLVELPVAGDQRRAVVDAGAHRNASTPGQRAAFQELQRGATAGRQVGDLVGETEALQRSGRVAARRRP